MLHRLGCIICYESSNARADYFICLGITIGSLLYGKILSQSNNKYLLFCLPKQMSEYLVPAYEYAWHFLQPLGCDSYAGAIPDVEAEGLV